MTTSHPATSHPRFSDLLLKSQGGCHFAFSELLNAYQSLLIARAHQKLPFSLRRKIDAGDIVQETCLNAWLCLGRFHGTSEREFVGWLMKILNNNLLNVQRYYSAAKRKIDLETYVDQANPNFGMLPGSFNPWDSDERSSTGPEFVSDRNLTELRLAIARLSVTERQVLQLRCTDRLTFEAVGNRLQKSPAASRKIWIRAIAKLRQQCSKRIETASREIR